MTPERAKQIADAAWNEAHAEAPPILNCADNAQYLGSGLGRMAFIAGYLKGSIASLLQDYCQPERVTMATGLMDVVYLSDVPFGVTGNYLKGCEPTEDDPGQEPTFEVQDVYLMGYRLPDEIATPLVAHYQSAIDERMEELNGPAIDDLPEFEVWE